MKEYLSSNYKLQKTSDINTLCEIPEGAEILAETRTGLIFYKKYVNDSFLYCHIGEKKWAGTHTNPYDEVGSFVISILWQRQPTGTLVEYLSPNDWSLHMVDVDNDAAGEDWIKVPEGAECCNAGRIFYKDNGWTWHTGKEWRIAEHCYGNLPVRWKRHTQPEELPFIDDDPKTAWDKQEGGNHYKNLKIQPMQYALENKLDYAQANVVKYVTRHASKNGKEDLLKAIHNIELMIDYYYGGEK